jgi:hypothetical protein
MIYGSSQTDPNFANYQGSQTYNFQPVASSGGVPVNAQGQTQIGTSGSVLGANTASTPTQQTTEPSQPSGPSAEEIYRQQQVNNISNKWDSYFGSLDNMMGQLPGQVDLLKENANIQAGQQVSDLTASTDQNKADLTKQIGQAETGQVKTLKDVSDNIRNLMQAGNTYLGSKGAGDSSAVNQYAYALTKLGSKARGDVMSQTKTIIDNINDRLAKVGNIFTQEKNRVESEKNLQMNNIAQWLVDQQRTIEQAKAQGQLDKGTDIQALTDNLYNVAVQKATQYENFYNEKIGALQEWAMNSSTSLKEAQSKMSGYADFLAPAQTYQSISGTPQVSQPGSAGVQYGGYSGFTDEEKRRLGIA